MPIERTIHYSFFFCLCKASVSVSLWWLKHDGSERPGSKQRPQIPDQNRLTDGILWPSDYHAYCQQLVNYVTVWISPPLQAKWESDPWKMYIHLLSEHCVSRHLKCLAQHAREPEMHAGFAWAFETLVLFARNSGSNLSVVVFLLLILNISSLHGFRGHCTVQGCCETLSGTGCTNTADGATLNGAFDASSSGGILGLPHTHQLVFRSSGHWGGTA